MPQPAAEPARFGIEVSVVMPCLNEADTVATCVQKARAAMDEAGIAGNPSILRADACLRRTGGLREVSAGARADARSGRLASRPHAGVSRGRIGRTDVLDRAENFERLDRAPDVDAVDDVAGGAVVGGFV